MIEGVYWFGDYQRWNLGWPNPNPAGAFIATAIPLLWWLQALIGRIGCRPGLRRTIRMTALIAELAMWFLLMRTYSRGALVAIVCGAVYWATLRGIVSGWVRPRPMLLTFTAIRIVAIAVLLVVTGFADRADPSYVQSDASVTNRLELWSGGLRMIAAEPLTGWGKGESGPQYMNWYQPLGATDGYAGMVNSWLHRAVEHGLPSLLPWLWLLLALVSIGLLLSRRGLEPVATGVVSVAATIWGVFAVANVFSTLWIFANLWWLPSVILIAALFALVWFVCRGQVARRLWALWLIGSGGVAVIALAVLPLAGSWLGRNNPLVVRDTHFALDPQQPRQWLMVPDPAVLGRDYGKGVRELAIDLQARGVGLNVPRAQHTQPEGTFDTAVLVGEFCSCPPGNLSALRVILIHPAGAPRDFPMADQVTMLMPTLDTSPDGSRWHHHAESRGWTIGQTGAIGDDARPVWPPSGVLEKVDAN